MLFKDTFILCHMFLCFKFSAVVMYYISQLATHLSLTPDSQRAFGIWLAELELELELELILNLEWIT